MKIPLGQKFIEKITVFSPLLEPSAWAYPDIGRMRDRWWVKWCWAGDPDLGFIDKHYKI